MAGVDDFQGLMKAFGLGPARAATSGLPSTSLTAISSSRLRSRSTKRAEENEVKSSRRAVDFKDTEIVDCMIPRNEIVAVPLDGTSRDDLMKNL